MRSIWPIQLTANGPWRRSLQQFSKFEDRPPSAPHATGNALPDAGKVGPVPGRIILTAEERAQMDIEEETK